MSSSSNLPDALREEWASRLAQPAALAQNAESIQSMSFRLGAERFCIDLRHIEEVIRPGVIRPLPHHGNGLLRGITSVRGRIIPCIWLDRLLQVAPSDSVINPRLMVMNHQGWRFTFVADEVEGRQNTSATSPQPLPSTFAGNIYCQGWHDFQGNVIASLDGDRLFDALRKQLR